MKDNRLKDILQNFMDGVDTSETGFINDDNFCNMLSRALSLEIKTDNKDINKIVHFKDDVFNNFYQANAYKNIMNHIQDNKSLLVAAPTGFGKSFLIRKISYDYYKAGKRVFIIVPTKELIADYIEEFKQHFKEVIDIHQYVFKPDFIDAKMIFVLTQERFSNFFKANPGNKMNNDDLVVFDEIHKIDFFSNKVVKGSLDEVIKMQGGNIDLNTYEAKYGMVTFNDSNHFERERALMESLDIAKHQSVKFIGFMPNFSKVLNNNIYKILSIWFNSKEYIYFDPTIRHHIFYENDEVYTDPSVKPIRVLPSFKKDLLEISFIDEIKNGKTLFYNSKASIVDFNNNPKIQKMISIYEQSDKYSGFEKEIKELFPMIEPKDNVYLSAIKHGIGVIIGSTPKFLRKRIRELYKQADSGVNALISNQTIIEGVNYSPDNLVIMHSYTTPSSNTVTSVSNLFGRVGRNAKDETRRTGNVFYIKTKKEYELIASKKESNAIDEDDIFINKKATNMFSNVRDKIIKTIKEASDSGKILGLKSSDINGSKYGLMKLVEQEVKKEGVEIALSEKGQKSYEKDKEISEWLTSYIKKNIRTISDLMNKYKEMIGLLSQKIIDPINIATRWKMKNELTEHFMNNLFNYMNTKISFTLQEAIDGSLNNISDYEPSVYDSELQYGIHDSIVLLTRRTPKQIYELLYNKFGKK